MTRPASALTWRIFLTAAAVVAVVLGVTLALLTVAAERAGDAATGRALAQSARIVTALLDGRARALESGALVFAQGPVFRSLVIEQRPEDLLDQSLEAVERTGASWVQIVNDSGVRLAKSDEPTAPPLPLGGSALIAGALGGGVESGVGVSGDSILFQAVAVPIMGAARVAGAIMAARAVDTALVAEVREATASDILFFVMDTAGTPRIVASSLPREAPLRELVARYAGATSDSVRTLGRAEVTLGGARFVGEGMPLRSAGGEVLGGFVALRSRDAELAPFALLRQRILLAGVAGLALAFLLAWWMARGIARPVLALAAATRRAADGDYEVEVDVRAPDEIGDLAMAVRTMLFDLREKHALVEVLSAEHERGVRAARAAGAPPAGPAPGGDGALPAGRVIAGRYEIAEVLGTGGAGIVYRALDRSLGEPVALKTLRPDALHDDPAALERLRSEIRLARRISHRNVVRTHDIGEADGLHFISMELVTGTSLRELLDRERRLPVPATLAIARQICRALEVAHEQGIIHRDIKPQNLMVQPDGVLKVMDFGIARLARRGTPGEGLTRTGMVVGTPAYMAPEQLLDDDVDARADLYAVGVVLYECLTGRRPFEADTPVTLLARKMGEPPPSPRDLVPDVPMVLSQLVLRTLGADRAARPASAAVLHDLLAGVEEPRASRPLAGIA